MAGFDILGQPGAGGVVVVIGGAGGGSVGLEECLLVSLREEVLAKFELWVFQR